MKSALLIGVAALSLAGCALRGPGSIVGPSGPSQVGTGTIDLFANSYTAAATVASSGEDESVAAYRMVSIGSELQYQLCLDFFRTAGKEQQWLLFGKDFLGTAGTIAAGILGASGGSGAAIAWVGLSAGAGVAGINIYERNFLFSENNVQAVQDLTLKAVSVVRQQVLAEDRRSAYTSIRALTALANVYAVLRSSAKTC